MGRQKDKNDIIKEQAGSEVVILLENYKRKSRRRKIFRLCICAVMVISSVALTGMLYYHIDSRIPSIINVRAGQEEIFDFGIPAKAEILSVSDRGVSNIPEGAVDLDLSEAVTLKGATDASYQMQVKLFGFLSFKNVDIRVIDDQELIPVGVPIGIYLNTKGVLVIGTGEFQGSDGVTYSPGKYILKSGDYITMVNGEEIEDKAEFVALVEASGGKALRLTVEREGETMQLEVTPVKDTAGKYKVGIWVRDNAQGVGTLTYIDGEGHFGALGHGIADVDTSTLMEMADGTLYKADIVDIKKGTVGHPGEMTGMIIYTEDRILGEITDNSTKGIFGICNDRALELGTEGALPIGLKQEITKGAAQILCTVDGTARYYDIEITKIHLDHDNVNRGIELTVTDSVLLELTGGIVQGMSGSPIIQNGKIIGAVTHVLVNDSARGYGIFIENMLDAAG